jgi:hypothetical protein
MTSRTNNLIVAQSLLFGGGGLLISFFQSMGMLSNRFSYLILTLLLLYFLWLQGNAIRLRHPQLWLMNPAVVSALMLFVLGYGVSNVLFFLPPETISFLGLVPDVYPAMVTQQYLVLLGAVMMYTGYWSPMASYLVRPRTVTRFQRRYLPGSQAIRPFVIPILMGVAVIVRLFAMSQGLYGFGGVYTAERLAETAAYSQYLSLLGGLGTLALLVAALQYFSPSGPRVGSSWFWSGLIIEILFGFLSGMKSAVVLPIVIAAIALYVRRGVVPWRWIGFAFAAIMVSYAIIEPFRILRNQDVSALISVDETVSVLQLAFEVYREDGSGSDGISTLLSLLSRMNLSYIGAFGIEFADKYETLPAGSPAFLGDLLQAPLHAVIPRFLWDSKPLGILGGWYSQVVMGRSNSVSIAMGPFAYLYFAGGYLAVAFFFFSIGLFQRVLWFRLTPWQSLPGAVVMLALLGEVANINSAVNGTIINLVRTGVLVFFLIRFIFRGSSVRSLIPSR